MKGVIVHNLREDSADVLAHLSSAGFSLLGQHELIRSVDKAPDFPGLPWDPPNQWWSQVAGTLDGLEYVDDLVGCVVWNSIQPTTRALCLAVQKRGLPAFEIDHGAFSTYLHGHFECDPAADHIFCSPEHNEFLYNYGYTGTTYLTGRPAYDHWKPLDRIETRKRLKLPPFQPMVLRTTTWTHPMSRWSDAQMVTTGPEEAFLRSYLAVQNVFPMTLVYSVRPNLPLNPQEISLDMERIGIETGFVTKEDPPLYDLLQAADVVVSPKGSAAVEAVLLDKPAIVVDPRPQLDSWAWEERGILACRDMDELPHMILRCLSDEATQDKLAKERPAAKDWFNGPGRAAESIAKEITKLCSS